MMGPANKFECISPLSCCSPIACLSFGYCRERNLAAQAIAAFARRFHP